MKAHKVLWTIQGLLAALFLFAGVTKLILPLEPMAGPVTIPVWFLQFIGVAETLGALGLILPGLFKIQQALTPVAAAGLVIIMVGATVITGLAGAGAGAAIPLTVAVLSASVAYGRWPRPALNTAHL